MRRCYVYGLVDRSRPAFRSSGRRIELVDAGGMYAAIENVAAPPAISEASLRSQHEIVCRLGERFDAVLPARFGTWIELAELRRVVALKRGEIEQALALVRNRVQMTLRLSGGGLDAAARESMDSSFPSGTDYLKRRRAATVHPLPPPIMKPIEAATGGLVVATRVQSGERGAALYQLIDRASTGRYRSVIEAMRPLPDGTTIRMSGPWPPFAFAPELWR